MWPWDRCSPDQQRMELILKFSAPTDITDLIFFWGMVNFSWDFVEGFPEKAAPLPELLKEKVGGNSHLCCCWQLLERGMEAVLSQSHGAGLCPVAYASKTLSEVERGFTSCEKGGFGTSFGFAALGIFGGIFLCYWKFAHSLVKCVLTGKINNGHVSSPSKPQANQL